MAIQYTGQDLYIDSYLTNISLAYHNNGYIADMIAPIVPVMKQSGLMPVYDQSHWFRDEAKIRAPGTKSQRGGFTMSDATYYCHRYSYGHEIPDEYRDNADSVFSLDRTATEFVTDKMQMRREVSLAAEVFTTGVWGNDDAGGTDFVRWDDYAGSDPLVVLGDYADSLESGIGREPNTLVMGKQAWLKLKWHPDLIDNIKYTQSGQFTTEMFASLIGIERILIGRAIYTTTPEGTAEASVTYSRIWGKKALMLYVPPSPSLLEPASMYTFTWNRVPNSLQYIRRLRDDEREVDIIEANTYYDHKVTGAKAGIFLDTVVS